MHNYSPRAHTPFRYSIIHSYSHLFKWILTEVFSIVLQSPSQQAVKKYSKHLIENLFLSTLFHVVIVTTVILCVTVELKLKTHVTMICRVSEDRRRRMQKIEWVTRRLHKIIIWLLHLLLHFSILFSTAVQFDAWCSEKCYRNSHFLFLALPFFQRVVFVVVKVTEKATSETTIGQRFMKNNDWTEGTKTNEKKLFLHCIRVH